MTGLAHISGTNMTGRLSVTRRTGTQHFVVIHRNHRHPSCWTMTGLTQVTGIDMRWALACGRRTVMASSTGTQHFIVIHRNHRHPTRR